MPGRAIGCVRRLRPACGAAVKQLNKITLNAQAQKFAAFRQRMFLTFNDAGKKVAPLGLGSQRR